ncbi:YpuI family protein [Bacillus sp. AGMB 02131]|uniref:YpuI family protein n=1 Tax=Peribacillus faecalis TaxID=2772559 RepID=A0A927CXV6_9BACI|nr:YpuI family protein [Peribacillus faecalis]MBD3109728.1 YpuI family protein [Peribacillus faecalis]
MSNSLVKSQLEEVSEFLGTTVKDLEEYLNVTTKDSLLHEQNANEDYYKSLLSNLRRLVVYCEEGYEACNIVLNNEVFHKIAAEKTLYKIFHQCIEEFFSPKNDSWYEDSRSAYTGKNSIKFHQEVAPSLSDLIKRLESGFQSVREDLEYYETDYRTKMINPSNYKI